MSREALEGRTAPRGWYAWMPWYAWMLGGLLPILVSGFLVSALADRLVFAAWALVAAAAYATALHRSWGAARPVLRRGVPLLTLALAATVFLALAALHREDLTLGLAALRSPAESAPSSLAEVSP